MLNKDVIFRIPIDAKDVEDRHYKRHQSIEQIINELAEVSDLKRFLRQEVNSILKEAHIKNVMARQFFSFTILLSGGK